MRCRPGARARLHSAARHLLGPWRDLAELTINVETQVLVVEYEAQRIKRGTDCLMWRLAELAFELEQSSIRVLFAGDHEHWLARIEPPRYVMEDRFRQNFADSLRPGRLFPTAPADFWMLNGGNLSTVGLPGPLWPAALTSPQVIEFDDGCASTTVPDISCLTL